MPKSPDPQYKDTPLTELLDLIRKSKISMPGMMSYWQDGYNQALIDLERKLTGDPAIGAAIEPPASKPSKAYERD